MLFCSAGVEVLGKAMRGVWLVRFTAYAASMLAMSGYASAARGQDATASNGDETGIRATMAAYNAALNSGKTAMVLPLYTEGGVFMPPYSQSAIGKVAVRGAYDAVFKELKFHVTFTIAEIVIMAPTWAFVRTNSAGTTDHQSTGRTSAEANQELFILGKGNDGKWRIARYSFSPTSPPGGS